MPQMSPLLWLNLYIFSLLVLMIFMVIIYFLMIYFFINNKDFNKMNKLVTFILKW